jgi:transposase InsO family protein
VRVSARKWAHATGARSNVASALAGAFRAVNRGAYDMSLTASECPPVDFAMGSKPYFRARVPILVSPIVGNVPEDDVAFLNDDEYEQVNSVCRSDRSALEMCVDIRRLKSVAQQNFHALPDVKGLLQLMKGCKHFTAVDLSSGFWALPILEVRSVREPTGATTPWRRRQRSTEKTGTPYICVMVDYFTKAAELAVIPDKRAESVARAFHDYWLARYGTPEWVTCDNGREFAGAFEHQLARFGIEHIHSSAYHAQANGAVERLVRTFKEVLTAKAAGAHDWVALVPQIRAEYMQRRHSSTGYSPNELIFARPVRLPPPVGHLAHQEQAAGMIASAAAGGSRDAELDACKAAQQAEYAEMAAKACDRILAAQQRHVQQHTNRLASSSSRGGRELRLGDLAYVCEAKDHRGKRKAKGPFVVTAINEGQQTVTLRTTSRVAGQEAKSFTRHRSLVPRCTTVVDALSNLLRDEGLCTEHPPVDAASLVLRHSDGADEARVRER